MPNYTFEDTETGEQFVQFIKMDDKEQYLKDNPTIKQVFVPIALPGDHLMGVGPKETTQFKERMGQIADAHPMSPLGDRYGSKTHKEIKIRDTQKKVRDRIVKKYTK
tara:strand:- start:1154 stop:1474 length:321 start_codon:yes stop_codon:yes gene_type:complete